MSKAIISTFPHFEPFTTNNFEEYQSFLYDFPQHCDFVLNNMLIWLSGNTMMKYCWLNGNLVLRIEDILYDDPHSSGAWITVIGNNEADKTLKTIFESGVAERLLFVPDYFVNNLHDTNSYVITEDLSNRDYILNIDQLLARQGKEYENFRYQISYVLRNYGENAILRDLDLTSPEAIKEIINSLHYWPRITSFSIHGNDPNKVDAKAIDKLLQIQPILPIKHQCLGLYIDGKMQAFSIFHIPRAKDKIAMGNHIKFNGEYRRLFDYMIYVTALRLKSQGIEILNAEQDMGLEGLRKHKTYLNPYTYYRKYSIVPR